MKDLTHYFNSPKEELTASKGEESETIIDNSSKNTKEQSSPVKKRKVYLSKRKVKGGSDGNELQTSDCSEKGVQSERIEEINTTSSKQKKRKLKSDNADSLKKSKPNTSSTSKKKPFKEVTSCETACSLSDSSLKTQKNSLSEKEVQTINGVTIHIDSSNSCEESIFEVNKTKRSRKLLDSDEEATLDKLEKNQPLPNSLTQECLKRTDSQPKKNEEKCTIDEVSPSNTRNSLFGYFNKIDKETALKQKSEKIKVEVLIHLPPEDSKINKSLCKPFDIKTKKQKKKLYLDNSDTIEVISSESIVDENSSVNANAPQIFSSLELKDMCHEATSTPITNEKPSNAEPKKSNLASIFLQKKVEKSEIQNEIGNVHINLDIECTQTKSIKTVKQSHNKRKKINKKCSEQSDIKPSEKASVISKTSESDILSTKNSDSIVQNSKTGKIIEKPIKSNSTPNSQINSIKVETNLTTHKSMEKNIEKHQKSTNALNGLDTKTISQIKGDDFTKGIIDEDNSNEGKLFHEYEVVVENLSEVQTVKSALSLNKSKKKVKMNSLKSKIPIKPKLSVEMVSTVHKKEKETGQTKNNENSEMKETTPFKTDFKKTEKGDVKTPKNKPITLNGYFTPKTSCSSPEIKNSRPKERKVLNKTTPSWVMKVRISSVEKPNKLMGK